MSSSFSPLQHQSKKILELLQQSVTQENPAWFLFKNKTRTPLFMTESIARLLMEISGGKKFLKARKKIKKLEDSLGAIEDYDALFHLFAKNKKIKKEQINYFKTKGEVEQKKLNEKLIKKEFYQELYQTLANSTLDLNTEKYVKQFQQEISKELNWCYEFFYNCPDGFTSMEGQVHEIRRKLRWISIYAQSLDGIIVLDEDKKIYSWEKKFITKTEKESPYNKIPVRKNLKGYIHFHKKAFLALSYVVAKLGEIKDKGLNMEALAKTKPAKEKAMELAAEQLGLHYTEKDLFKQAHALLQDYFVTHKLHDLLLVK